MPSACMGLYVHIPFCAGKCPYCDFYSLPDATQRHVQAYVQALCSQIAAWGKTLRLPLESVYFGGGTPSRLPADAIVQVLDAIRRHCTLLPEAEITLECNPSDLIATQSAFDLERALRAGVNRFSLGLQSARDRERAALGRRGSVAQVTQAIGRIRALGMDNISLDLMLGIPYQTQESLEESIHYCAQQGAAHVSAYLLKIEEGTPFAAKKHTLCLPHEDAVSDLYLFACARLAKAGYTQYEISNFARPGRESRHNLRYWNCGQYLGLGPAAHSFIDGRRFYYPPDLRRFLGGEPPVPDGTGGDFSEYAMLRLRLTRGLREQEVFERFGHGIPAGMRAAAAPYAQRGLLCISPQGFALTREGFLLSNRLIGALLEAL